MRRESDPLRQARLATDLLGTYQQRSVELARLRRDAIEAAATGQGLTYSAVASALGLSKGRITQIRQTAPPRERAFFGVGPVTLVIPKRQMPGRTLPVIATEDALTAQLLTATLEALNLHVVPDHISANEPWTPPQRDVVVVCGPKSSPAVAKILNADPQLHFETAGLRWRLRDVESGRSFESPMDWPTPEAVDIAYLGRHDHGEHHLLIIAGVHAIGSLGAAHHLSEHLDELYAAVGDQPFSMLIQSTHDGLAITHTAALREPTTW